MEIPLAEDGVCDLSNINLTKFIINPFSDYDDWSYNFNWSEFEDVIKITVRFLDNVLDVSLYPFEELKKKAQDTRKIGLNAVAGLGSFLAMMKVPYDSPLAREIAQQIQRFATNVAYETSALLAKEKGAFPLYDKDKFLKSNFLKVLNDNTKELIEEYGIRNSTLITIPPVGTGSILAGNISSGIEPIFALEYGRKILQSDGSSSVELMEDYAWSLFKESDADDCITRPDYFKTAMEIDPYDHIKMQICLQRYIDNSISKTANIPNSYTIEEYNNLLLFAITSGVKGFTSFREGTREGVLSIKKTEPIVTPISEVEKATEVKGERPRVLDAKVYQIKEADSNHTYCTIGHVEQDGVKQPWEMFMSASGQNGEWYAAVGRLASRLMRKTGDVEGVIDELKHVGGDHGYFTQEYGYMNSKPQHLGYILEEYANDLKSEQVATVGLITGAKCDECGGDIIKRGGCSQCENGCILSYKCG